MSREPNIQVQWRVADPGLINEFVLEKIVAGNWTSIYEVRADELEQKYSYTSVHPDPGVSLYRLKLIEKNNSFFYSPVRQINIGQKNDEFILYPNPASQQLTVTGDFSSLVKVKLFDMSGKLKQTVEALNNNNSITIDLSSLQAGVYVLQIGDLIKKLVISK